MVLWDFIFWALCFPAWLLFIFTLAATLKEIWDNRNGMRPCGDLWVVALVSYVVAVALTGVVGSYFGMING